MKIDELYLEVDRTLFGVLRPEKTAGAEYICADCSLGSRRVRLRLRLQAGGFADLSARLRAMGGGSGAESIPQNKPNTSARRRTVNDDQ